MFADLDATIRELLVRFVPVDPGEIDITFEIPNREWSGRLTRPTINCFFYDIRENIKLRTAGWDIRRSGENNTASRQRGLLRFDATYQITVWARAREDEHRLLWRVLAALARHSPLPADLLHGELVDQPMVIPTTVGQPEQMPANLADLWQGLDNPIHPMLAYVVTLALDPEIVYTRPLVLTPPSVSVAPIDSPQSAISGRVRDRGDATRPIAGAVVLLLETGARATTDEEGCFTLSEAPRGPVTLVVRAAGKAETRTLVRAPSSDCDLEA